VNGSWVDRKVYQVSQLLMSEEHIITLRTVALPLLSHEVLTTGFSPLLASSPTSQFHNSLIFPILQTWRL
jgi:hypothetical protein